MTASIRTRLSPAGLLFPIALIALVVAILVAARLVLPAGLSGPASIVTATVVMLVASWLAPKPTLLAFALLILFYDTLARYLGSSMRSLDEAILPGLLLIGLWRTRPWRRGLVRPLRDGAILTVAVLAVVSSLLNGVPLNVWVLGLLLMFKGVAFLYLAMWYDWDLGDVKQASLTVLGVGLVVLAIGVVEVVNQTAFRQVLGLPASVDPRGQLPGIASIFVFPVLYSWFMAFVAMFLFSNYIVLRRWWMLAGAILFSAGTFLSGRRRAIAGLAVALVGGLVAEIRRGVSRRALVRLWLPVGAAVLVLGIVFAPGIKTLIDRTVQEWLYAPAPPAPQEPGPIQYINGNPRLLLYQTSATIAATEFPFGVGLGRFGSPMSRLEFSPVYAQYGLDRIWGLTPQYPAYVTDTFWPHVLGEIGVFGLAAYVVFLVALGLELWRATRAMADPVLRAFSLGAFMVFLHSLVESLASSMYESPPRIYLAFGAMGIALALARRNATLKQPDGPAGPLPELDLATT
jgi:hypothetical protein